MHSLRATRNININRIFFILHVRVLVSVLLQVYVPVHVKNLNLSDDCYWKNTPRLMFLLKITSKILFDAEKDGRNIFAYWTKFEVNF